MGDTIICIILGACCIYDLTLKAEASIYRDHSIIFFLTYKKKRAIIIQKCDDQKPVSLQKTDRELPDGERRRKEVS